MYVSEWVSEWVEPRCPDKLKCTWVWIVKYSVNIGGEEIQTMLA